MVEETEEEVEEEEEIEGKVVGDGKGDITLAMSLLFLRNDIRDQTVLFLRCG